MEENIIDKILKLAKGSKKKIVLPESNDLRVLKACQTLINEDICEVILIGNQKEVLDLAYDNNISLYNVQILDPNNFEKIDEYINAFYELRKNKGITLEDAKKYMSDYVYFGTMMVKLGDADGLVSGAIHSTSDTLRPALQIVKQKEGIETVSSFFIMETQKKELGSNGLFIFSDCGLIIDPTEEQMKDIIFSSVESFKMLSKDTPRVALLSYSTNGSAKGEKIDKIKRVLESVKKDKIDFEIDGEMQLDSAIIPEVAELKFKESTVAGHANILIFPNLEAGNIGYKIAERFGDMIALGPITQGIACPINDLSRGCNYKDIVGVVALTVVQANNN